MELKDFVKETIVQIVEGIDQANATLTGNSAFIASTNLSTNRALTSTVDKERIHHYVSNIEFDVAINVQNSETKAGGAGLEILSVLNVGGKGSSENTSSSTSRIKFSLPLALPTEPENKLFSTRSPKRLEL